MPSIPFETRYTATDGSQVALADCDTFYASCERVSRPDLTGRPIVVLSNNDGCIVARSREAKALGIPMGTPEFQIRRELQKTGTIVFSSNYTLYGDLSRRVMQTLESVIDEVEIYSIDEAFLHLRGAASTSSLDIARLARERVRRWVGLPISIGIGPTKVLAKLATEKKAKISPEGVYELVPGDVEELLQSVPVEDVWGIGRRSAKKLQERGIATARQLRDADPGTIRKILTVSGLNILMELRGIPSIGSDMPMAHQSIISSRSLGVKVRALAPLKEAAAYHAARGAEKLRQKKLVAGIVSVRIQTAHHHASQPQHDETTYIHLQRATSDSSVIIRAAQRAVEKLYKKGYAYAKIMIVLLDLQNPARSQVNMLDMLRHSAVEDARRTVLMGLMDKINHSLGRGTITFAAQGTGTRLWHMKREMLSPRWTTDIREILRVKG